MMKRLLSAILTAFISTVASAQTYTTMQWGLDKTATPYNFGANINSSWTNLGTVSSAGVWQIPSSNLSFLQSGAGAVLTNLQARGREVISVMDYGAKGDGTTDDAPAFRAAVAACTNNAVGYAGYRSIYVPVPPVAYLFKSLDASGLGAVVIGDGTNQGSCAVIEGEGANAWGNYVGGVNIKLDAGLNRPVFRLRSGAGGVTLKNLRVDGNSGAQTGYADATCNGRLYTVCAEDGVSYPEGAFSFEQTWITNGYNGNYYQGWGRGMSLCSHGTFEYGGQTNADASVWFNGYDTDWFGCGVGASNGNGIFYGAGSQHHFTGGAVWMSRYDGIIVNGGKVNHITFDDMNVQFNGCNGINELAAAPFAGSQASGHLFSNITFDSNSHTTTNTCSDVKSADTYLSLVSPAFNGAVTTTDPLPKYNVEVTGSGAVQMTSPKFAATANGTAITNNFSQLKQFQKGELHVGDVAPTGNNVFSVDTIEQYDGIFVSNGTNVFASIIGTTATNDNGLIKLLSAGVQRVQMSASGDSYFNGGRLGVGNAAPVTTLDVTGTIRAGTYAIGSLPACNASIAGAKVQVSDGDTYASGSYGATVGATGAVVRSVMCTNTAAPATYAWVYD